MGTSHLLPNERVEWAATLHVDMSKRATDLRKVARWEQRIGAGRLGTIRPLVRTAELLLDAYADVAMALTARAAVPDAERAIAASLFIRSARRTIAFEVLEISRHHWPESILLRRRAMELLAYARMCWLDPGLAMKWLHSGDDRHAYRLAFSNRRIREALRQLHPAMPDLYMELSNLAHPSIRGVIAGIHSPLRVRPGVLFEVDFFDDRAFRISGHGRALTAERAMDSTYGHLRLLEGFCNRCLGAPRWAGALTAIAPALSYLGARVERDAQFYNGAISSLDDFRRRRTRTGQARARINESHSHQ